MKQLGILDSELTDGIRVFTPNRVVQIACEYQARPASRAVASTKHELRVRELHSTRFESFRMMLVERSNLRWLASSNAVEEIPCLMFELIDVGDGQEDDGRI